MTFPPQSKPASPHQIAPHRARRCGPRSLALVALLALVAALAATPGQAIASKQAVDFFGGAGTAGGQFGSAAGVAVNDSGAGLANAGDVYALDAANNRIERFGRDDHGTPGNTPADTADDTYFFISAWGADVDATPPGGSDYEICTVAADCQQAVASAGNGTSAGDGSLSLPSSFLVKPGIALDQDTGDLYVADAGNDRVNVYAGDGAFLRSFGYDVDATTPGTGYEICPATDVCKAGLRGAGAGQIGALANTNPPGTLSGAQGIAVSAPDGNPATGTVFLADAGNRRVDTYGLDGASPSSFGSAARFSVDPLVDNTRVQPSAIAVDSRGIVYIGAGGVGNQAGNGDFRIERYDSANANGGGVGFLAPVQSPQNEEQRLLEQASAGQFRLSFDPDGAGPQPAETTPAPGLPFNATTAQVQTALEALPSIGAGNVTTAESNLPDRLITIRFIGALANTDAAQLVLSNGATPLTGSVSVSTAFDGHGGLAPTEGVQALAVDPDTDAGGPDTDVLYAERGNHIQQFGPANPAGLTAAPTSVDDVHGTSNANNAAQGLAIEPATGRLYAATGGTAGQGVYVLDLVGPPPTATMDSIDGVTANGADLHATIDPNGPPATRYHFDYVDDATYQADVTASGAGHGFDHAASLPEVFLGVQPDPQAVSAHLEPGILGLDPNTLYHVRVVAGRKFATPVISGELTFTTDPAPPLAETDGAPVRSTTSAQLNGRVTPLGSATTYHFDYGTDQTYGQTTPSTPAGSGQLTELAGAEVENLTPDTTYHYRLVADNGVGSPVAGADMTVRTRAPEQPLSHGDFPGPPGSDRAWEQVSLPDPSGNPVAVFAAKAFSNSGDRAVYGLAGGSSSAPTGSVRTPYYAERTATGWRDVALLPSRDQLAGSDWTGAFATPDLSSVIVTNYTAFQEQGSTQIWRLAPGTAPSLALGLEPGQLDDYEEGFSLDGSRLLAFVVGAPLDPAHPEAADHRNLYDLDSAPPHVVSLLPGDQPGPCGLDFGSRGIGFRPDRWLSDDGSRAYFEAASAPPCSGPAATPDQLYLRDLVAGQSTLISGPPLSGPDCGGHFLQGTENAAFFVTSTRLDPADSEPNAACATSNDVYRYDLGDGSLKCVTCVVPGGADAEVAGSDNGKIAVSADGSRVYFRSAKRLLLGAAQSGVYRVDVDSGDLAYVAPGAAAIGGAADPNVEYTPDGSVLIFASELPSANPLGGVSDNGATRQIYRYDDADRSLVCVSCPQDGSPPSGPVENDIQHAVAQPKGLNNTGSISADGDTVTFVSPSPLVAADQNTDPDTGGCNGCLPRGSDVYEWRDGRPLLVTSGQSPLPPGGGVNVEGITPSGRDVFFIASAAYTPDAPDAVFRLYDARVGGGFSFPPAGLPPCDLNSGACEGVPSSPSNQPGAGSAVFQGAGNQPHDVSPKSSRCPKGKVRRKGRCVAKKPPRKHHHKRGKRAAHHNRRANR